MPRRVAELGVGHPVRGPLNSAAHAERVAAVLADLPAHARVETGGRRLDRPGWFFPPTVVSGVRQEDDVVQREIFGALWSRSSPSTRRPRRSSSPTAWTSASRPACGRPPSPARCGSARSWTSAACGWAATR
ncbi:aldehyde dehydrogenase family protein [Streptomyces luteolus]|uniref:aldehyde dehydrogenase family protein n=1 Tax=Streptomyces luteolus TaxID=3043615 RepID=UPI0038D142A0